MNNSTTVLLVEDNETYRKAVKLAMEVAGFTVLEASTGKQGLEVSQNQKPDIIVCDIHMPEMDGITLLTELKKNESTAKIPLVMLTNLQEEIDHSVQLGAEEAILKASLTPHQVIDVCRKHLQTSPASPVAST